MELTADQCYRALCARDGRFDGHFFVGVTSTRVYCRPVCRAKTPRRAHCRFFGSAAGAEAEGFRPCLRCRPELAPGRARVDAQTRLAQAAAALIDDGRLEEERLPDLAARLGVTDRHLRRAFHDEFGVTPVAYAQTQRLLLAKRLLTDTDLPVTEVALASGFASLRRFHHLFRTRYRLAPTQLRRARSGTTVVEAPLEFEFGYRPPFDWHALLSFLGKRTLAGVEAVEGGVYRRTLRVEHHGHVLRGWVAATDVPGRDVLRLSASPSLATCLPAVLARARHLFDLSADPRRIGDVLGPLSDAHPGLRLPGTVDGFELALRAVLGQQVTVRAAATIGARVVRAFGERYEQAPEPLTHLFPTAQAIARLAPARIAELGVVAVRARAMVQLARAVAKGELELRPGCDIPKTMERLRAIPGVGAWTAHYIAMRALAWPDAFPHPDVAVLRAMGRPGAAAALRRAEAFRPWRAYAVLHLWQSLEGA